MAVLNAGITQYGSGDDTCATTLEGAVPDYDVLDGRMTIQHAEQCCFAVCIHFDVHAADDKTCAVVVSHEDLHGVVAVGGGLVERDVGTLTEELVLESLTVDAVHGVLHLTELLRAADHVRVNLRAIAVPGIDIRIVSVEVHDIGAGVDGCIIRQLEVGSEGINVVAGSRTGQFVAISDYELCLAAFHVFPCEHWREGYKGGHCRMGGVDLSASFACIDLGDVGEDGVGDGAFHLYQVRCAAYHLLLLVGEVERQYLLLVVIR